MDLTATLHIHMRWLLGVDFLENISTFSDKTGKINLLPVYVCTVDILFSSNHNIHKSSCCLYFWASDPIIERFL